MFNLDKALALIIQARENSDFNAILDLEYMIKAAIAEDVNRRRGTYKPYVAIKKMIQKCIKDNPRPIMTGVWEQDGKQYYTNGYCLIELYTPVKELPKLDEDVTYLKPSDYFKENEYSQETQIDVSQVKLQFKWAQAEVKAKKLDTILKSTYGLCKIGESYFNIGLINDIVSAISVNNLIALYNPTINTSCILKADNGRAFVMPIIQKRNKGG